jgi:hypothetical protein
MKAATIQLRVLSELTDAFEQTDVVVSHIQSVCDVRIAGQHVLTTLRLLRAERELLVLNTKEEVELLLEYSDVDWGKRSSEFWQRLKKVVECDKQRTGTYGHG